jgi:hypothetical protein
MGSAPIWNTLPPMLASRKMPKPTSQSGRRVELR